MVATTCGRKHKPPYYTTQENRLTDQGWNQTQECGLTFLSEIVAQDSTGTPCQGHRNIFFLFLSFFLRYFSFLFSFSSRVCFCVLTTSFFCSPLLSSTIQFTPIRITPIIASPVLSPTNQFTPIIHQYYHLPISSHQTWSRQSVHTNHFKPLAPHFTSWVTQFSRPLYKRAATNDTILVFSTDEGHLARNV